MTSSDQDKEQPSSSDRDTDQPSSEGRIEKIKREEKEDPTAYYSQGDSKDTVNPVLTYFTG